MKDRLESHYITAYVYDITLQRWGKLDVPHVLMADIPSFSIVGGYTYAELDLEYPTYADLDAPGLRYIDIDSSADTAKGLPGTNFSVYLPSGELVVGAPIETSNFRAPSEATGPVVPRLFLGRYKLTRDMGIWLNSISVNKLFSASVRSHTHSESGTIISTSEVMIPIPRQPGVWNITGCGDSVSVELIGNFKITDVNIYCSPYGTKFHTGVPEEKKYYSHIVSELYPLWHIEGLTSDSNAWYGDYRQWYSDVVTNIFPVHQIENLTSTSVGAIEAKEVQGFWTDSMTAGTQVIFAELRDVTRFQTIYPQDFLTAGTQPLSGTYAQTLFNNFQTLYPDDFLTSSTTPLSGTYAQTFFPISHTLYQDD